MNKTNSSLNSNLVQENLEHTKGIIRNKMIKKNDRKTNNDPQSTTQKAENSEKEPFKTLGMTWPINKAETCVTKPCINRILSSSHCKITCLGLAMIHWKITQLTLNSLCQSASLPPSLPPSLTHSLTRNMVLT